MFVNKIGTQHIEFGTNCQDFGIINKINENSMFKMVCDGCSEGLHSEVGAKLFTHLISKKENMEVTWDKIFKNIINLIGDSASSIKDFLCFTVLYVYQQIDVFKVSYCGDGYIILQDLEGNITFKEIDNGEYPKYYAYNFMNPEYLKQYKEGVEFTTEYFYATEYKNVGVASDGIRFIVNCEPKDYMLKDEFIEILKSGKESRMKRFINKHYNIFKDDVTIAF